MLLPSDIFRNLQNFICFQAQEAREESAGQTPSGVRLESILRSWARHQDTFHHRDVKMTARADLSQPLASVIPVFYLNTSNHRLTASPLRTPQQYKLLHNDKMTNSRHTKSAQGVVNLILQQNSRHSQDNYCLL